jgi:hypothetical protein
MRYWSATSFVLVAVLLTVCDPMFAHHGNVAFDTSKSVEMKATVVQLIWANPHSILKFDVKDDKGNVVHWMSEFGSPAASTPEGWTRDTVKPGDVITVYVAVAKAGTPFGMLNKVVLADGKMIRAMGPFNAAQQGGGDQ